MTLWQLSTQVYLDTANKCYKKIIVINIMPTAPLAGLVKTIQNRKVSPFQSDSCCCPRPYCLLAIQDPQNTSQLLCLKDIGRLFSFLSSNGYTIQYELTKIMQLSTEKVNNLICYIS